MAKPKPKSKSKLLKRLPQTGKRKSITADKARKAGGSGKRVSATGNKYWETRRNRSDQKGKRI